MTDKYPLTINQLNAVKFAVNILRRPAPQEYINYINATNLLFFANNGR
jgi:hypothetical protein